MWVDLVKKLKIPPTLRQGMQIPLQISKSQFVPRLIPTVLFASFLNRVIGQMNKLILHLVQAPGEAGCSDVPFLVPISLDLAIVDGDHHIHPDVKFPSVVKKRVGDIFLHY